MDTYSFENITLSEMDQVKLMNRVDRKYWFHSAYLPELLKMVEKDYYLLHIDGESRLKYTTTYFDTDNDRMFSAHHNGKLNRFKIRKRKYVNSGISFLEIKFKNNKGRTIKKRIPTDSDSQQIINGESEFIETYSPFDTDDLHASLKNRFTRLTLVNKNFKERCTIDLDIEFESAEKKINLDNLVIVEIKSDGKPNNSPLALALRKIRIKSSGFSKYCVGRTVTDSLLKINAFKEKIRTIEKVIKPSTHLI